MNLPMNIPFDNANRILECHNHITPKNFLRERPGSIGLRGNMLRMKRRDFYLNQSTNKNKNRILSTISDKKSDFEKKKLNKDLMDLSTASKSQWKPAPDCDECLCPPIKDEKKQPPLLKNK